MPLGFPSPALLQRGFVHTQLEKLYEHLESLAGGARTTLSGVTHQPEFVAAVRSAVEEALGEPAKRGDYYSHNPLVNILQSALSQELERKRLSGEVEHDDERMGDPFTKADIAGWVGDITLSLLHRLLEGTHAFNDTPATADLEPDARLVLISDWGTGREGAAAVARAAQAYVQDPTSNRPVHVIHLGDTYYSGTPGEQQRNVLTPWPVSPANAATTRSWALNGNHDMYSGGQGLFETTLRDPRFARQTGAGDPTTWLILRGGEWNVLGLDTAWQDRLVEIVAGRLEFGGSLGHLTDTQVHALGDRAAEPQRLLVLSHHQLFVAYGGPSQLPLSREVRRALDGQTIDAWFWGHEHDCLAFADHDAVGAARAIGNGAVPELVRDTPATPIEGGPLVEPDADAALPQDHPLRAVTWEYRGYRVGGDNQHWIKHAFAVADLDGASLNVRYVDDEGVVFREETI